MAILSEYEEEIPKQQPPQQQQPQPSKKQFTATLDPSNPSEFLHTALQFVATHSPSFLLSDSFDHDLSHLASNLKQNLKADQAEALAMKKLQAQAQAQAQSKEAAATAAKKEEVATPSSPMDEDKGNGNGKQVETSGKDQEKSKYAVPNKANGLDLENYSWGQSLQEVNVTVPVPPGTKSRFIVCDIKKNHLKVGLKGQPPIIDGELYKPVKPDDCFWSLEDQKSISILLTKHDQMDWWRAVVKGEPEIDTQKVEPESSKLGDLDPETRSTVEKMMFDQRQKQMGRPTSDEMQKEELMKKFMSQHPEMDFSNLKFGGGGGAGGFPPGFGGAGGFPPGFGGM